MMASPAASPATRLAPICAGAYTQASEPQSEAGDQIHVDADLYGADCHVWISTQAALLRARRLDDLDARQLAEELEAMRRRERNELVSRLIILISHLLEWQYQPAHRSSGWRGPRGTAGPDRAGATAGPQSEALRARSREPGLLSRRPAHRNTGNRTGPNDLPVRLPLRRRRTAGR